MKREKRPLADWVGLRVRASGNVDRQESEGLNRVLLKNVKVATYTNSDPSAVRSVDHVWVVLQEDKQIQLGARVHWLGDVVRYRRRNRTEDYGITCIKAYWLEDELEGFFSGLDTAEKVENAIAILTAELQNLEDQIHGFPACISYHHYRQRLTNGWFRFTEMKRVIEAKDERSAAAVSKVKKLQQRTA